MDLKLPPADERGRCNCIIIGLPHGIQRDSHQIIFRNGMLRTGMFRSNIGVYHAIFYNIWQVNKITIFLYKYIYT